MSTFNVLCVPQTLEESLEPSGLIRAQSLRAHVVGGARGEGLKRVSSAPQLGEQGALLKRKLSRLEAGPEGVENSDSKHKKHGGQSPYSDLNINIFLFLSYTCTHPPLPPGFCPCVCDV